MTEVVTNGHAIATRDTHPVNARTVTLAPGLHDQGQMRWTGALRQRIVLVQGRMLAMNFPEVPIELKVKGETFVLSFSTFGVVD